MFTIQRSHRTRLVATLSALGALAVPIAAAGAVGAGESHAEDARTTKAEARGAVHVAFDNYVDVTDSRLVIGSCEPVGQRSQACNATIAGRVPQRYRVVVTAQGGSLHINAALLPDVPARR